MLPPRVVSTAHRIQTKFGRAGDLSNAITHAKCEKIDFGKGLKFYVLVLIRRTY